MAWYAVVSKLCSNNYSVGSYTFITTFSWFLEKAVNCCVSIKVKLLFPLKSSCSKVNCYRTSLQIISVAHNILLGGTVITLLNQNCYVMTV